MDLRELKGLEIAARAKIVLEGDTWLVPSQSGNGKYRVKLAPDNCNCDDFSLTGKPCKHVHAARLVCERDHGGKAPVIDTDTIPKKPTYKQNWPVYNDAQIHEKHRFQVLLADLCRNLPARGRKGIRGRFCTPWADVVFACAFKVYSTVSSRRFGSDLLDAHTKGYLSRNMHANKVNCHLESPELTPILKSLIEKSALPLCAVETVFAPDSTGFSTSRMVRWHDEKYGGFRSGHDWVKVHAMCGVKTHIVTAVEILDRDAADSPQFKPMVETTAKNFTIEEVTADKAYLGHDNLNQIDALGGTAFIPYKVNSLQGEAGTVWERMYHYFQFRREEFLAHYHMRSNAETVFSMIKAKFRDHVRSTTDVAMKNEALCKFLCHNICCVIMAQAELGIEAVFWGDDAVDEAEQPAILPMVRPG